MELTRNGNGRDHSSSFRSCDSDSIPEGNDETELLWAAIERLPTFRRLQTSLFDSCDRDDESRTEFEGKRVMTDVTELPAIERHLFIEKIIKNIEKDNLRFLKKLRERIDR
ncbi:hypothetical protein U1Q18_042099 [Sarracenia purpurea var. burkii]